MRRSMVLALILAGRALAQSGPAKVDFAKGEVGRVPATEPRIVKLVAEERKQRAVPLATVRAGNPLADLAAFGKAVGAACNGANCADGVEKRSHVGGLGFCIQELAPCGPAAWLRVV